MSFDLNADDIIRESNRIQIRGVIEGPEPHLRGAVISVEVFNNADGKTTVSSLAQNTEEAHARLRLGSLTACGKRC